jgi:hypothetical protein
MASDTTTQTTTSTGTKDGDNTPSAGGTTKGGDVPVIPG